MKTKTKNLCEKKKVSPPFPAMEREKDCGDEGNVSWRKVSFNLIPRRKMSTLQRFFLVRKVIMTKLPKLKMKIKRL